ncbi:MAG: S-layer homology domain-containing protein [Vulcanimicrobiaceae bacterium]
MKRLARLGLAVGFALSLALWTGATGALATPFSDVPANHWAYQDIQSLAADGIIDGYPSGKFEGNRPMTRYEMAVVVARAIAHVEEAGASKGDLAKLQKLVDALKDELDALGVRVSNLEDKLNQLDERTKFAQSLSMHGLFLPNLTLRQRYGIQRTVLNTTGAAVPTYYGVTVPSGGVGSIDPFVNAFMASDPSNSPFTQANSGIQIRQDSHFALAYQINDNLTVSLPVHILNFEYGGATGQQSQVDLEPGIDINIAKTGAISNLDFKYGIIDNMTSSLTGLAFRAPFGDSGSSPYQEPLQPYQKGVSVSGTIGEGAFGLTNFQVSFTRVDQTLLDTQTAVTDPSITPLTSDVYLFPVVPPQAGFTQTTPAGSLTTNTFNAGTGTLAQVFLTQKAVDGSVYISAYNGCTYASNGTLTGGPAGCSAPPPFTYNDAYNSVVFGAPLGAGSVVSLTYRGLVLSNNTNFQRYMVHARVAQTFASLAGLQVGLNFNRIFDFDDLQTSGSGPTGITQVFSASPTGTGLVSDTVLGLDAQVGLPFNVLGPDSRPILFGEFANSKYTPDYRNISAVGDSAGVVGVRLKIKKVTLSAQYQSVGVNFFSGAPFEYYGNPPALFAFYKLPYLPDFFGFGNNLAINGQFDNQFTGAGFASPNTQGNPNLTFLFPLYNTLRASGPQYFSAFAPNSKGLNATLSSPITIGGFSLVATGGYQHLEELRPNSLGSLLYGPAFASSQRLRNDVYSLSTQFALPAFGQKVTANLSGSYETLQRLDTTGYPYVPFNPTSQMLDPTALSLAQQELGGSGVTFYPNYINMRHLTLSAAASLPLTKDLVLSGLYSTQSFGGEYGTTLGQNISERKDFYQGGITYNIPKTNSSLTFLEKHYNYSDDVIPNFNLSQNRQDVNFTVRF